MAFSPRARRYAREVHRFLDQWFDDPELTHAPTFREIGRALHLSRSVIERAIDVLEVEGVIAYEHVKDGRRRPGTMRLRKRFRPADDVALAPGRDIDFA